MTASVLKTRSKHTNGKKKKKKKEKKKKNPNTKRVQIFVVPFFKATKRQLNGA